MAPNPSFAALEMKVKPPSIKGLAISGKNQAKGAVEKPYQEGEKKIRTRTGRPAG